MARPVLRMLSSKSGAYSLGSQRPLIGANVWIAPNASVIGNVVLKESSSVWFNVVIRGDNNENITVGARTNVQDGSVLHADAGVPLTIGEGCTIGHMVMLHGCTIGECALSPEPPARYGCRAVTGDNSLIGVIVPSSHCQSQPTCITTSAKQACAFAESRHPANASKGLTPSSTLRGSACGPFSLGPSLAGIGATVLNGATIGRDCLIGG